MFVRNLENFSYNPNCLNVGIGGCGGWKGGWVSFMFWQILQSILFCYVRFLHGFDQKRPCFFRVLQHFRNCQTQSRLQAFRMLVFLQVFVFLWIIFNM